MAKGRKAPEFKVPLAKTKIPQGIKSFQDKTRFFVNHIVNECKLQYEETHNPLYV